MSEIEFREWEPVPLTAEFHVAAEHLGETEAEVLATVKERMTRMLAAKIAEELAESPGGTIYSPLTYTIRPMDPFDDYRIVGTLQALRLPAPESNEYRLIGGPMNGSGSISATPDTGQSEGSDGDGEPPLPARQSGDAR
jgi:hypothetical protein